MVRWNKEQLHWNTIVFMWPSIFILPQIPNELFCLGRNKTAWYGFVGMCVYMYMYKSLFSAVNMTIWPNLQKQLQMWFCMKGTLKINLWSLTVGYIWFQWYLTSWTKEGACMRCDKGEINPLNSTFWFQWSHACFWKTWVALNASKAELIGGKWK